MRNQHSIRNALINYPDAHCKRFHTSSITLILGDSWLGGEMVFN